jgi:hypothetical protein
MSETVCRVVLNGHYRGPMSIDKWQGARFGANTLVIQVNSNLLMVFNDLMDINSEASFKLVTKTNLTEIPYTTMSEYCKPGQLNTCLNTPLDESDLSFQVDFMSKRKSESLRLKPDLGFERVHKAKITHSTIILRTAATVFLFDLTKHEVNSLRNWFNCRNYERWTPVRGQAFIFDQPLQQANVTNLPNKTTVPKPQFDFENMLNELPIDRDLFMLDPVFDSGFLY